MMIKVVKHFSPFFFLNSHSEHIEFVKNFLTKMIKYIFYHPRLKTIIEFYTYYTISFFFGILIKNI